MSSSGSRPLNKGQLATSLPRVTHYLTGHDSSGKAILESVRPGNWRAYDGNDMAFNQVYTTTFPADLNDNKDIATHDKLIESGKLGLVNPGGTVCRMVCYWLSLHQPDCQHQVDFAPGYECMMHRTQSVDFGIVLEGTVELILDNGKRQLMQRGDVAVQRATIHAWKNPSPTEWTRICFILQDCQPLVIQGKKMGEDLGRGAEGLPASGND